MRFAEGLIASCGIPVGVGVLLFSLWVEPVLAQNLGPISAVTVTSSNTVRLVVQPQVATAPDLLVLQSSDSPLGPWWDEAEFQRNTVPGGYEFLTPHKAFYPQRYYRFSLFTQSSLASPGLPYIRFVTPNQSVRPGQSVTLLGANFGSSPGDNTVNFSLPSQSWTAAVKQAATNFLVATVPTNLLLAANSDTGTLYQVTVSTSKGTGNGVGCSVARATVDGFMLRPSAVYLVQPPGNGKQTLVVGGGMPPYHLVPQSTSDLAIAVAIFDGPVLTVTAQTNVQSGGISVGVQDSSPSPGTSWSTVNVLTIPFSPTLDATFHTLLQGSAPSVTFNLTAASSANGNLQIQRVELQLQNAGVEVSALQPEQVIGLLKSLDPVFGTVYAFQYLIVTEVDNGLAKFDVRALGDGGVATIAQGQLIETPPTMVIDIPNLSPGSLVPQALGQELIFADNIFRLPAGAAQNFSVVANFTSVSARDDIYLPQETNVVLNFSTTNLTTGAPRIDRLVPIQGEVGRNVQLFGAGFVTNSTNNQITFAGSGGTRVAADIVLQTNNEIVVSVPPGAITGPVELSVPGQTSNDYMFYVRFHPDTALVFDGLTNNVPAAPRLLHQQPVDQDETAGEVPLQGVVCTLNSGQIIVTNLTLNQQVGTTVTTSFYDGSQSTNILIYAGQETNAAQRYLFREVTDPLSTDTLAWFYYSGNTNGVTLELGIGDPLYAFSAGALYDFRFTTPMYRPPANQVAVRIDTVSQQWMAPPGNEMHRIVNSIQSVQ
jgi:hypothetical protein